MTDQTLTGYRIVILEDDYFQAYECKDMLEEAGAQVIAASATIPDLDSLKARGAIDAVLIDINLGHEVTFDFARDLIRSAIPFAFLTGYDPAMLPADLADCPYISKPADGERIVAMVAALVGKAT